MLIRLAYGEEGLDVDLPDAVTTVVEPRYHPPAPNPGGSLRDALRNPITGPPLRDRVPTGATVAVAVCDGTRPQPREAMLHAVLDELDGRVRLDDVVVLVATGTHRGNTPDELIRMLGGDLYGQLRVVNHDARDPSTLTWCGRLGNDVPTWLNREWLSADVRVTTGFVEPTSSRGSPAAPS